MSFFGRYIEVTPPSRIVWTNDEGDEDGAVIIVTFEDKASTTLVAVSELFPSEQELDEAIASGSTSGWGEQLGQLDALIRAMPATAGS